MKCCACGRTLSLLNAAVSIPKDDKKIEIVIDHYKCKCGEVYFEGRDVPQVIALSSAEPLPPPSSSAPAE